MQPEVEGVSSGRLVRKPPVGKRHLSKDSGGCSGRIWNENILGRRKRHIAANGLPNLNGLTQCTSCSL